MRAFCWFVVDSFSLSLRWFPESETPGPFQIVPKRLSQKLKEKHSGHDIFGIFLRCPDNLLIYRVDLKFTGLLSYP